ncbi:MAG: choice-of-anchor D domain-containing protein, partial [Roseimicrobium sp.]
FTTAGGTSANRIAKWNGSAWSALGTGMNGTVSALAADSTGHLYLGGSFSFAGTTVSPFIAQANLPTADIAVAQATPLTDSISSVNFGTVAQASSSTPLTFTISNPGTGDLTSLAITKDGADAGSFTVSGLSATSIPVGAGTVTFSVTFAPTSGGAKAAAIHIASNVSGAKNPFDIALTGQSLSFTQDTDSDGMNDASEFQMAALGFDWQVNQSALVNTLTSNLNGAGYFTPAQVQALHVGTPLLQRDALGQFKLTLGVQKSTTLEPGSFTPFPMTAPQTTINGAGKLEFLFTVPENAAFFRLEAQ